MYECRTVHSYSSQFTGPELYILIAVSSQVQNCTFL